MAVSDFQYATHSEFIALLPNIEGGGSTNKVPIRNWQTTATADLYEAFVTGLVSMLYKNGEELTPTSLGATPSTTEQFNYVSATDKLQYFDTGVSPNDVLMESGSDWTDYVDEMLEMASQELNGMLDSRFSTPIPKQFMNSNESTPDYDYILKKLTAYIAGVNIMRADNPMSEEADKIETMYEDILRKLNQGEIRLKVEINNSDKNGEVIEITRGGTLYLVESYCEQWSGALYDLVNIKCSTGGAFGTAKIDVRMHGNDAIKGTTVLTGQVVTGGLQHIGNGLYIRFDGKDNMNSNDEWDVRIRRNDLEESNAQVKDIPIHRGRSEVFR